MYLISPMHLKMFPIANFLTYTILMKKKNFVTKRILSFFECIIYIAYEISLMQLENFYIRNYY